MERDIQFLLIEDDEVDAEVFTRGFYRYLDYPLQVISSADNALSLLRERENYTSFRWPYVIILDLNLPRLHGLDFLQKLRQDPQLRSLIVFVLTSSSYEVDRDRAYQYAVAGYIEKDRLFDANQSFFYFLSIFCQLNVFA